MNTPKNWCIYATFTQVQRKTIGIYTNRACAEQDAIRYRRYMPQATVEVVWTGGEING